MAIRIPLLIIGAGIASLVIVSCAKPDDNVTAGAPPNTPAPSTSPAMVRGTVDKVSDAEVTVKTATGVVTVKLTQPFHLYDRVPSDLSKVTDNTFVGVTSVKQSDGSEKATEIHIFPEELRGLGEGSHMMNVSGNAQPSKMTNGNVSSPGSRMSNGSVKQLGGSTIQVQYQDGTQKIVVPADTPVTALQASQDKLTVGQSITMVTQKAADGSLSSDKAIMAKK